MPAQIDVENAGFLGRNAKDQQRSQRDTEWLEDVFFFGIREMGEI